MEVSRKVVGKSIDSDSLRGKLWPIKLEFLVDFDSITKRTFLEFRYRSPPARPAMNAKRTTFTSDVKWKVFSSEEYKIFLELGVSFAKNCGKCVIFRAYSFC